MVPDGSESVFFEEATGGPVVECDERGRSGGTAVARVAAGRHEERRGNAALSVGGRDEDTADVGALERHRPFERRDVVGRADGEKEVAERGFPLEGGDDRFDDIRN